MPRHLYPADRLQPALLDRLIDEQAGEGRPTRHVRVMNQRELRQAVLRDLQWLFNVTALSSSADLDHAPLTRRSVLNFGLPALAGQTASTMEVGDLERAIRQAILDFEPRILPASLEVRAVQGFAGIDHHNAVGVDIRGQLWAEPVPLEILLRTEVDLETGNVAVTESGGERRR
ncbi:MAG: type VI secretion system baseplate subunit TssE [Vicinamibacterales bacterium]